MRMAGDSLAQPYSGPNAATTAPTPASATAPVEPSRHVFGFAQAGGLNTYTSWNLSEVTDLAYFGLHVDQNSGHFVTVNDTGWTVWTSSTLDSAQAAAQNAGDRFLLTVVYQDDGGGMCNALQHQATTISDTVSQVQARHLDGVNIDYEGASAPCGSTTNKDMLRQFVQGMRAALGPGLQLSVDTYGGSAAPGGDGFFDLTGMAGSVDFFFVMAYPLDNSNWSALGCASYCFSPTSPYSYYKWNDDLISNQYVAAVSAAKTVLGLPYFGYAACVNSPTENATPSSSPQWSVPTQTGFDGGNGLGSYSPHRDSHDGVDFWATYTSPSYSCTREIYIEDAYSLSAKYTLAAGKNLRGVGIWSLDMGGGRAELWGALAGYLCSATLAVGTSSTTAIPLTLSAPCSGTYDLQQNDTGMGTGWLDLGSTAASSVTAYGYPGHSYQLRVRRRTASLTSPWSTPVSVNIAAGAANGQGGFGGIYTLEAYGGVHADGSPPFGGTAYWPGSPVAQAAKTIPVPGSPYPQAGLVLDKFGGLHPFGGPVTTTGGAYFGWDIARDIAFLPTGTGGYVLDGYGGFHPFGVNGGVAPPNPSGATYWGGWDIARRLVIFSDGNGGYVMDAYGGLHPFGIGMLAPGQPSQGPAYWPGTNIARTVVLLPGKRSGYILDSYGGVHPVTAPNESPPTQPSPTYFGWDIARSIWLLPGSTPGAPSGYTLDGYGGLHAFGSAPANLLTSYWPGQDIARDLAGQ